MLGLGLNLTSIGNSLLNVVRSGLQLWYKANETQAPLGEEEIANGGFNTGPELVNNNNWSRSSTVSSGSQLLDGDDLIFPGDSNTAFTPGQSGITLGPEGFRFVTQGTSSFIGMNAGVILTEANSSNATVAVTYTILQSNRNNTLSISNTSDHGGDVHLDTSVGTHTLYFTPGRNDFLIKRRGNDIDVTIANVSVKQTNPNDSWSKTGDTVVKSGTALIDNGLLYQTSTMVNGKKYRLELDVSSLSLGGSYVRVQDNDGNVHYQITSDGHHTVDFTHSIANEDFQIAAGGSASAVLSNITLKEITNSVKDFSPNNNNGVLYSGKALNFDGASDEIDIGAIALTGEFTVALWYNVDDPHDSDHGIFGDGSTDDNLSVQSNIKFRLRIGGVQVGFYNFSQDVQPGDWARIVLTRDSNNDIRVYRNNTLSSDSHQNTSTFTVSNLGKQGAFEFDGSISDFQVYDKCWTTSDVTYDYNNPDKDVFDNSNSNIVTTDCKALYRLNEGAGDRVYNAAPVLGENFLPAISEIPIDSTDTDEISIINGNAVFNSNTVGGEFLFKNVGAASGSPLLEISVTVENYVSGKVRVYFGNPSVALNGQATANGNGTFKAIVIPNGIDFYIQAIGAFEGTVTAVSAKKITLSDSYVQTSWVSGNWKTAQPYIPQYAMSSYSKKIVFGGAGSGDQVDLGSEVTLAANEAASISFWFTYGTTDTSTDKYILGKISSATDYLIINPQSGGVDKIQIRMNNVSSQLDIDTDLTLGKIYHCVLTMPAYSSGSEAMKCYINGVLQSDTENRTNNSWDFQRIGGHSGTVNNFDGILDEIAYFTKELSQAEVQEIFNAGMALDVRDHSAANTGSEVFANGFDTLNLDSPAVTSNGRITIISHSGLLRKTSVLEANTAYKVTMNIESFTSGKIYCGGTQITISQTGLQTFYVTSSSNTDFGFNDPVGIVASSLSVIEVNLKGYWRNNGTETWTDLSLYENDGTVNGSPTTIQLQEVPYFKKDTFGLPMNRVRQKGLNLDGDSYVKVDDDSSLGAMDDGFTCAFWYRHFEDINTINYSYLVAKGTGLGKDVNHGFCVSVYDNKIYADLNTDTTPNGRFNINYSIGAASSSSPVWYYITATYNGSDELELYVDATSINTSAVTGSVTATAEAYPITIGTDKNYYSGEARSVIDEVKWYNRALTQAEITKNFKASKSKHSSTSNWSDDFDDGFI